MVKSAFYLSVGLMLIGCGGSSTPTTMNATPHPFDTVQKLNKSTQEAYLDAINAVRTVEQNCGREGVKPAAKALSWNDALYAAAYEHSYDLAESNTASHNGSGTSSDWTSQVQNLGKGSSFKERIDNNGYLNWKRIGENLTFGTVRNSAQKALKAWLKSDGHCANLMNPEYTEIGMAHIEKEGTQYTHYWTQNFGAR